MSKILATTGIAVLIALGIFTIFNQEEEPITDGVGATEILPSPYTETNEHFEAKTNNGQDTVRLKKNKPEAEFLKWGGKESFSISYNGTFSQGQKQLSSDKVEWVGTNEKVHSYKIDDETFEFEVIFDSKPASNNIDFQFTGWEDLDFNFQAPLNELPLEAGEMSCTQTQCVNFLGEITRERPEDMINSVAIYHKTKRDNFWNFIEEDGRFVLTRFWSGKVGHIKRLKLIDALGDELWVDDISYSNGVLTAHLPPSWMNKATYPVRLDPQIGQSDRGASNISISANDFRGSAATTTEAGTLDSISAWTQDAQADPVKGVLILENGLTLVTNGVGNAVATETTNPPTVAATSTMSTAPSLSNNESYIFGIVSSAFVARLYYDTGSSGDGWFDTSNSYASPTDLSGDTVTDSNLYSIYGTYTASGGGGGAVYDDTLGNSTWFDW